MYEMLILGFVFENPSYKYEIKQKLSEMIIFRKQISDGTIYPVINRLIKNGYIVPDESKAQRQKFYSITEQGSNRFLELLENPKNEDISDFNKFYGYLHFARYLKADMQIELIKKRMEFINSALPYYMHTDNDKDYTLDNFFHHYTEILAEDFYAAEMKNLNAMINKITEDNT